MLRLSLPVCAALLTVCCLVSSVHAVDDMSRLMPEDVIVYVEFRSVPEALSLVEKWTRGVLGQNQDALDEPLGDIARDLEMEPAQLRVELRKVKRISFAVTRIDREREEPEALYMADLGEARPLRDALEKRLKTLSEVPAATVLDVPIYGGEDTSYGCVVENHLIGGESLEDVKGAVTRLKGQGAANLEGSARFKQGIAGSDAKSPVVAWVDMQQLNKSLRQAEEQNDDLGLLDSVLDLKTVDTMCFSVVTRDAVTLLEGSIFFSGENRTYAAFRTQAVERTVTKFFSSDYALVHSGTLVDGKAQWQSFKELVARVETLMEEEKNDFAVKLGELERAMKIQIGDGLANMTDYAVGVRMVRGEDGPRSQVLFVLNARDAAAAAAVMKNVEEAAKTPPDELEVKEEEVEGVKVRFLSSEQAASDYAYAMVNNVLLLSDSKAAVADAIRTNLANKSILDEPGTKKSLGALQTPHSKLLLINPAGIMLPGAPRNPHAPPPAVLALTTVESPRRIDLKLDCTETGSLLRAFAVMLGLGAMAQ